MTIPATNIPIIVLAAGQSSRMRGADKLLEKVDGEPLLRRQAKLARRVTSGEVLIALPPAPHPRHDAIRDLDVTIVEIQGAEEGMNASIRQSFAQVTEQAAAAMLLLCDLPDLQEDDLRSVIYAYDNQKEMLVWRGATKEFRGGHPIIFSRDLFADIARLRGDDGARGVVAEAKGKIALVKLPGNRARADLDTPEDWAKWRARNIET
ncbi:MAG: NTP transferase domain-containing protein [Arenibacterium sp.]